MDTNVVIEQYRKMTDGELINFVTAESGNLTPEAFMLLKQECVSRGLHDVIEQAEDGELNRVQGMIRQIESFTSSEFNSNVLKYSLNEKRDGKSSEEIVSSLIEKGLTEDDARVLIEQLEPNAERLRNEAGHSMLTGLFIGFAGIALMLISPDKPYTTFLDIMSICGIVTGIFLFFISLFKQNKYKQVLKNIYSK
jgi:hypothetical protein